jgi:hypothetical protein
MSFSGFRPYYKRLHFFVGREDFEPWIAPMTWMQ